MPLRAAGPDPQERAAPLRADAGALVLVAALLAASIALLAYLRTLAPDVPAGDSGELITVARLPGVAHPPGYPLYTLLGFLWCGILPLGSVAWRMNLFSAVTAAAAVFFVARLVARRSGSPPAGFAAGTLLAFSGPFWKYAVVAEVFALNALMAALLLVALDRFLENRASGEMRTGPVAAMAFLSTLLLSHHHTLVLLALPVAGVALGVLLRDRRTGSAREGSTIRWRGVIAAAAAGLLPLLYLPLAASRNPALAWGDPDGWGRFVDVLLRREYGTFRLDPESGGYVADQSHVLLYLESIPRDFTWPGLGLLVLGVGVLLWRRTPLGAALLGFALLQLVFFTRVNFPADPPVYRGVVERFHILPAVAIAVAAGLGMGTLAGRVPRRWRTPGMILLAATCLVLPVLAHRSHADQRGNRFTGDLAHNVLASVPEGGVLFTRGDIFHNGIAYLQHVEGVRPDVSVLDQELLTRSWYVALRRDHEPGLLPDPLGPEDRYDGTPAAGTLAWFDHLRGRRPAVLLGMKDETWQERYELVSRGMLLVAVPPGEAPSLREQAEVALELAERFRLDAWFREYDPWSIEVTELWRFPEFVGRTLILLARPQCFDLTPESSPGFARLLRFLDRDRDRGLAGDPELLAASGFLRAIHPAVRDPERAREDLEQYLRIRPGGARAADARRVLASLEAAPLEGDR